MSNWRTKCKKFKINLYISPKLWYNIHMSNKIINTFVERRANQIAIENLENDEEYIIAEDLSLIHI